MLLHVILLPGFSQFILGFELRIHLRVWVHGVSFPYREKVFRVDNDSSLLQDPVRSLRPLHFHIPHKVAFVPLYTPFIPEYLNAYILQCFHCILLFLSIQPVITVFVELFGDDVVFTAHESIPVQVITDMWLLFIYPVFEQFSFREPLILGYAWLRPPFRNPDVIGQNVGPIISRLLFELQIPPKDINFRSLMLLRIKLYTESTFSKEKWVSYLFLG